MGSPNSHITPWVVFYATGIVLLLYRPISRCLYFNCSRRKVNIVSHLLPVSVWSIVSWATILLSAELIPLPEEANRSRPNCVFSAITCQCRHRSFPRVFFPASFRNDVFVSNAFHEAFIATSGSLRSRHPERVWRPKRRQYVFVFMGDGYVTCTSQCRLRSLRANPL